MLLVCWIRSPVSKRICLWPPLRLSRDNSGRPAPAQQSSKLKMCLSALNTPSTGFLLFFLRSDSCRTVQHYNSTTVQAHNRTDIPKRTFLCLVRRNKRINKKDECACIRDEIFWTAGENGGGGKEGEAEGRRGRRTELNCFQNKRKKDVGCNEFRDLGGMRF